MKDKTGQRVNPEFEAEMSRMEMVQSTLESALAVAPLLRDVLSRLDSYRERAQELDNQIKNTTSETERLVLMDQALRENRENQLKALRDLAEGQQAAQALSRLNKQLQTLQATDNAPQEVPTQLVGDAGAGSLAGPVTTVVTANFRMPRMLTVHVLHVQFPAPIPIPYVSHMVLVANSRTSWFDAHYNSADCNEPVFAVRIRFNNSTLKLSGQSNRRPNGQVDPLVAKKFPLCVGKMFSLHIVEEQDKFCVEVDGNLVAQLGKAGYAHLNIDHTASPESSDQMQGQDLGSAEAQNSGPSETQASQTSETKASGSPEAVATSHSITVATESLQALAVNPAQAQLAANNPEAEAKVAEISDPEEASETSKTQASDSINVSQTKSNCTRMGMKGEKVELLSCKVLRKMFNA